MAVLAKRNGENIAAKKLGESMKTVDKKIRNLMNAIEEGIVTATTKQRLQELEIERGLASLDYLPQTKTILCISPQNPARSACLAATLRGRRRARTAS